MKSAQGNGQAVPPSAEPDPAHDDASELDPCAEVIARLRGRRNPFDRYRLVQQVGEGAMGQIFKARDEDLHRDMAMKVMKPPGGQEGATPRSPSSSRHIARFVEEAQITGQLDHPGIVPVHELGLDPQGRLYFTMKLVRGRTLREVFDLAWKREEGWSTTRVLGVLLKVCEAMSYAHEHKVIHRDLKPGNIMVGRYGEVFVMDWGLARLLDKPDAKDIRVREQVGGPTTAFVSERHGGMPGSPDSPLMTMDGDVIGTPAYMSPEQASGHLERVGIQTDVYAIGAILYHVLTRRMPYVEPGVRADNYAVWRWLQQGPPTAVHKLASDAPAELVAICEKAMEREPSRRYTSAGELGEDLRAYLENRVVRAHRTGPLVELQKWVARNRAAALSLVGILVVVLAGTALVAWRESLRAQEASRARDEHLVVDLLQRADDPWPIDPGRVVDMEAWLSDARELAASEPARTLDLKQMLREGRSREVRLPPDVEIAFLAQDAANRARLLSEVLERYRHGEAKPDPHDPRRVEDGLRILPAEVEYWSARGNRLVLRSTGSTTWSFDRPEEERAYERTSALLERIRELRTRAIPEVAERLEQASSVERKTIVDPARAWAEAIASIADRAQCPAYEGAQISPQLGLIPLARDPESGLWEFWHVLSGDRPVRNERGVWVLGPETGIVLVLVPGSRTTVGAQSGDPSAPRCDPLAGPDEGPPQPVDLAPYFLSKYEMSQGQWLRATGEMPSRWFSGLSRQGTPRISRSHPVEHVSWNESAAVLGRWRLALPTEAQWEHAARGETDTPYWSGSSFESLEQQVNFCDLAAGRGGMSPARPTSIDDGYTLHAPVGSFPPNRFGLHEVLGNVAEWCSDWYADSCERAPPRDGDGLRIPEISRTRVTRGGGFKYGPNHLRITTRLHLEPDDRDDDVGIRPARRLDP